MASIGSADYVGITASGDYYPPTTGGSSSWPVGITTTSQWGWDATPPSGEWMRMPSSVPYDVYIKEEVRDMRGLFQFYVVDPEKGKVVGDGLVIAKNKETAKIKALAPFADKYDLDDLDIICNRLGDVREKKEVQEVKIVK